MDLALLACVTAWSASATFAAGATAADVKPSAGPVPKAAPVITLLQPEANAVFAEADAPSIFVQASASDMDAGIRSVTFFACKSNGSSCVGNTLTIGTV